MPQTWRLLSPPTLAHIHPQMQRLARFPELQATHTDGYIQTQTHSHTKHPMTPFYRPAPPRPYSAPFLGLCLFSGQTWRGGAVGHVGHWNRAFCPDSGAGPGMRMGSWLRLAGRGALECRNTVFRDDCVSTVCPHTGSLEEGIALINDNPYGNGTAIFTRSVNDRDLTLLVLPSSLAALVSLPSSRCPKVPPHPCSVSFSVFACNTEIY